VTRTAITGNATRMMGIVRLALMIVICIYWEMGRANLSVIKVHVLLIMEIVLEYVGAIQLN